MSLIESLRKNSAASTVVAVAVLAVASFLIYRQLSLDGKSRYQNPKWMYDLNTGQLVIADAGTVAPHDNGSGTFDYGGDLGSASALVDAVIYSCGDPTDIEEGMTPDQLAAIDAHIGYLLRNPQNPSDSSGKNIAASDYGLVSEIDGQAWFPQLSPRGMAIQNEAFSACGDGGLPKTCRP